MLRDDTTVIEIVDACLLILEFKKGLKKNAFLKDRKTQSAVLHQLMIVGEAVKRLSNEFRSMHAEIPWKDISGMRDKLIHAYSEVDIEEVWKAIDADIPRLLSQMEPLLPDKRQ